jgi:hypothetical protein
MIDEFESVLQWRKRRVFAFCLAKMPNCSSFVKQKIKDVHCFQIFGCNKSWFSFAEFLFCVSCHVIFVKKAFYRLLDKQNPLIKVKGKRKRKRKATVRLGSMTPKVRKIIFDPITIMLDGLETWWTGRPVEQFLSAISSGRKVHAPASPAGFWSSPFKSTYL